MKNCQTGNATGANVSTNLVETLAPATFPVQLRISHERTFKHLPLLVFSHHLFSFAWQILWYVHPFSKREQLLWLPYNILALQLIHILTEEEVDQVASDLLPYAGGGGRGQETMYRTSTEAPSNSVVEGFNLVLLLPALKCVPVCNLWARILTLCPNKMEHSSYTQQQNASATLS